jgi:hypothetical protein
MLTERVYPLYSRTVMEATENCPHDNTVPEEKWDNAFKLADQALITERKRQRGIYTERALPTAPVALASPPEILAAKGDSVRNRGQRA